MPLLTFHAVVAKEVADRLRNTLLDERRGNLYLGATAPDIRIILKWERKRTHFFDLDSFEEQNSVAAFFEAYPDLRAVRDLDEHTLAFVTGYLTHIALDEAWVQEIYRPFFGDGSPMRGDFQAKVMDRLLQFSLDKDRRSDSELVGHLLSELTRSDAALQIGFIDHDTLAEWKRITLEIVNRPPEWQQFRHMIARHLGETGPRDEVAEQEFLRSLPDLLENTVRYLTPERIRAFLDDSTRRSLEVTKEYLQCA